VRLREELGAATAQTLVTGGLDALWAATRDAGADAVSAANVIANQLVGAGVDPARVNPSELAKLVSARDEIPRKTFDEAIAHIGDEGFSAEPYLAQKAVADTAALEPIVDEVLAANTANVAAYRAGKSGLLGFFVGQVMKATNGQADARVVNELVRKKLEA
jgi:aspartyl-tRNA(Asn)/glutamyl-tRNA(Gln) amidotransferase subunit B